MKTYKIYTLSHPITKEIRYIGFTSSSLEQRLVEHISQSKRKRALAWTYRDNWIKSLTKQNLRPVIELLETTTEEEWQDCERYWISQFKCWGFRIVNHTEGGISGKLIVKRSPEALSAWKKSIKQYSLKGEFIREWSSATDVYKELGIHKTTVGNACRKKSTAGYYQWRYSDDNSEVTEWTGMIRRSIKQYSIDGILIKEWKTAVEAANTLNIKHGNIFKVLAGRRKTAGMFIWKYSEDDSVQKVKITNGYDRPVIVTNLLTNEEVEYPTSREAAKSIPICYKHLSRILNGKIKKSTKMNNKSARFKN